ncbi:BTBD2-like protein [Mya arenaria]|uniref:BTBD2-like protein n=1 Tax=Mya arenaria TaxID=6604 RepID=A0ABY7DZA4_MYAAR|nr:BTB/POZ domain-containing protein 2-like [Mya arenaria]XP_052798383.1 BTB/POZ domain-containing protein 2-like [Mya arenaria]WAR01932.1 BTBD2-like protein [Mya arenaria]
MSESWQHAESFAVTNTYMLDAEVLCDVTILAGKDEQEVKCHRFMLASRSPVFYTMFCGSLPETGVVQVPDVEASVFRQVVRFVYSGEIQVMPESAMALLYVAKKYDIQALTDRCRTFLEKIIAVDNVCIILEQAVMFDEKVLIQQCLTFVTDNSDQVFRSNEIMSISPEALRLILQGEKEKQKLQPEKVYATCTEWAKQSFTKAGKENFTGGDLRQQLGDMILLVDFARMTFDSYMDHVDEDDILSNVEKIECIRGIRKRRKERPSFIARFGDIKSPWSHGNLADGISFRTPNDVILCSVALYRPCKPGNLSGTLEILEDREIVLTQNVTIMFKDNETYENINLVKEITIRQGVTYSVRQTLKGQLSYYGVDHKETVKINGILVTFMDLKADKLVYSSSLQALQIHGITLKL